MRIEITHLFWLSWVFISTHILPSSGQKSNSAQPKKNKKFASHLTFHRLSPFKVSFCSLTKGITPKVCRKCVCVLINPFTAIRTSHDEHNKSLPICLPRHVLLLEFQLEYSSQKAYFGLV